MEEKAFWEKRNFIQSVWFELPEEKRGYPFDIEAVAECGKIELEEPVTILTGENGSGKSTILEAIAVAAGFNPEGGSRNFSFSPCDSHSQLYAYTHLTRGIYRPKDGYFLRAESFYNVATDIDRMDKELLKSYGGVSLHSRSHGESFLALVQNRFGGDGLYIFDEPEAALSPVNQLALLRLIHRLVGKHSQFLISTHSPILLSYPYAQVWQLRREKGRAFEQLPYESTDLFRFYQGFMRAPKKVLDELLKE